MKDQIKLNDHRLFNTHFNQIILITDSPNIMYFFIFSNKNMILIKIKPETFKYTYTFEKGILNLMTWIDEHPEYALLFNSDHGLNIFLF